MDLFNATDEQIATAIDASAFTPTQIPTVVDVEEPINDPKPAPVVEKTAEEVIEDPTVEEQSTTEEDPEKTTESTEEVDNVEESDANEQPDAQAQLKELFAPLMANGKEINVDNIEDARRLMQMGAGFNKKMATLKPHLKVVQLLDKHGIKEEDLSFLIDIHKKNPSAISKLLAESNIDPLNLNTSNEYTPNTYTVSDSELELKDAMDDLKDSPSFGQVLDVVVNKLDAKSKELLLSKPENLRVLNEHFTAGIYQKVMARVDTDRALGKLNGLSDIEAYHKIGSEMHTKGEFNKQTPAPKVTAPAQDKVIANESKLKSRKLAASPTKSAPGKQNNAVEFNPFTASDEEIAKMTLDKFL